MIAEHLIVFDTDWASDAVLAAAASCLVSSGVKSTWFITHDSPEIRKLLARPDLFEVGIHPNFGPESSHGKTPKEVVEFLMGIVPNAKSVRTHNLVQSSPLLKMMREDFGILHDTSLLLPTAPNLVPHDLYLSADRPILRFPSFWEDDVEMATPGHSFSMSHAKYRVDGLKLFAFHPIHVALNSRTPDNYVASRSALALGKCSMEELRPFINTTSEGTGTLLREIVEIIKSSAAPGGTTVSELATQWRRVRELQQIAG